MPWGIKKVDGAKPYAVFRKDTGKVVSTHASKTLAEKSKAIREAAYHGKDEHA